MNEKSNSSHFPKNCKCLSVDTWPLALIRHSDQSNSKEELIAAYGLKGQQILMGSQEKEEATGPMTLSLPQGQRMTVFVLNSLSPLYCGQGPNTGNGTTFSGCLLPSVSPSKTIPYRDTSSVSLFFLG